MQDSVEMSKATADYVKSIECGVSPSQGQETKIYMRRWLILGIFVFYSASNAMQWTEYTIIGEAVIAYYNVLNITVEMTSIIYMITYIVFIFPASWFLDKYGLRNAAILGSIGTAAGSWIKIFSAAPDKFWVTFTGHTLVAVSQTLILSVPSRLAAVWFGSDQVSSACSIGVFGNQLGVAIGFLFPPMLVPEVKNVPVIGQQLQTMFYIVAAITTVIFVLILLFFKAEPPLPPSPAQAVQREAESENFCLSVRRLVFNRGYLLLLISYATNVGVFYAISTLLYRIIGQYQDSTRHAGQIGLTIVLAGMLGSVVCGVLLDKTHKFKETTLGVYIFSFLGLIVFTFTLNNVPIYAVYITAALLGFFMTGYLPVGFEFAAELTYPEPEGTSAGLLNGMTQVFGIIFTILYGVLIDQLSIFWANIALCVALGFGALITGIIPNDLRRQNAKF